MRRDDDDTGLPIQLGPLSNGEYFPRALSEVARETIRRTRQSIDSLSRRAGMSRRDFLLSVCGSATMLLALNACSAEEKRAGGKGRPGGTYAIPPTSTTDPDAARAALAGDEFVFDVQGHFLEYTGMPTTPAGEEFWTGFPQQNCGDVNGKACFSITHFLEEMFLKSDTSMVVLSALPIAPEGSPMSAELMDQARRISDALCGDQRVLVHSQALPNVGDPAAARDAMAAAVARSPVAAWKVFTNYPDLYEHDGNAWRLDDGDPALPQVGQAFVQQAVDLGVPIICAHKGFSAGRSAYEYSGYASPIDFGAAARNHPEVSFVAYHSGFEPENVEGPFDAARPTIGADRLIASMLQHGIGPNQNVYAELGSTWWTVMSRPEAAAHTLGKLLRYVGEDNVLWGTDALFYGSPQGQIQAFRAFEITPEFQERFGYPALTPEIKKKVLGLNALRLHDVDPVTVPCAYTRDELEEIRRSLPTGNVAYGPRTEAEQRAYVRARRGRPS